ncbi:hypothetical protein FGO68_gene7823 [Halteria grandinella]|uniref:Uncharacterized protein n=1 Tax=Halteria grandinella TaxID=5974 RepID=A0A8J8NK16_HALGN|nr:hypothetical protein FGO68_gene7823 [Halteria grandinella]
MSFQAKFLTLVKYQEQMAAHILKIAGQALVDPQSSNHKSYSFQGSIHTSETLPHFQAATQHSRLRVNRRVFKHVRHPLNVGLPGAE